MYDLFEGVKLSSERSGRGKSKSATVASQFKDSLTSLMQVRITLLGYNSVDMVMYNMQVRITLLGYHSVSMVVYNMQVRIMLLGYNSVSMVVYNMQ